MAPQRGGKSPGVKAVTRVPHLAAGQKTNNERGGGGGMRKEATGLK